MSLASLVWGGINLWPYMVIVMALLAAALVLLYPGQVRSVPQPWRWLLPLLRGAP